MDMKKIFAFLSFIPLAVVSPACAWEADVHYGLTLWLGRQTGLDENQALAIAQGNAGADSLIHDARFLVAYICTRLDDEQKKMASYEVSKFHFPWTGTLPSPPSARRIHEGSDAARAWSRDLIDKNPPRTPEDRDHHLRDFGASLHALQDSFSHVGVPGILCEPNYGWGHPAERGGPREHYADHTHYDGGGWTGVNLTVKAAQLSYEAITKYRKKYFTKVSRPPVDWATVERFARAATKDAKREALAAMGVTESPSFRICELTIPGPGCSKTEGIKRRWDWVIAKTTPVVDAVLNQFFSNFFSAWVMERDLKKVAAVYVELDNEAINFYQVPSAGPDVVAGLLGLWLLTDHSISAQNGHGRKMDPQRAAAVVKVAPKDRIAVNAPFEAFVPIDKAETWFQILPVRGVDGEYLAVTQFRHTPYDAVVVRARRNSQGQWRIVRLGWEITH